MSNQPAKSSDRKRSGSGPNPQASQGEGGAAFPRATTFTRAFTLDGSAFTQFGRSVTDTIGLTYETEEQWTKSLIAEYVRVQTKGVDGDMPLPAGFCREYRFWRVMFYTGIISCLMGLLAAGFLNIADKTPKFWSGLDEAEPEDLDYWRGKSYWLYIPSGAALFCGILRYLIDYPDAVDGLFKEINHFHVDWRIAPQTIFLSMVSLSCGATLGPEQALGTVGGGIACFLYEKKFLPADFEEDDRKLLVLAGMTAAIGALFPSPILTVMMMFELGHPPKSSMEAVTILAFASAVSFIVYYAVIGDGKSWLEPITDGGKYLSFVWEYENSQNVTGFVIGIISACISILSLLFIGVTKQILNRIRKRLEKFKFLSYTVPPTIAGLIIGGFNYAMPMTVGNGNMLLPKIIKYGFQGTISTHQLLTAGFARILLLGLSMNSLGYVGGFIFPTIAVAVISGVVCYQQYSYLPYGLCLGCFIAALPSGICPMPFTLSCLSIFMFYFGIYQTSPILIATITSYVCVCGSGLFAALQSRAKAQELAEEEEKQSLARGETAAERKAQQEEFNKMHASKLIEDDLSLQKYLNAKPATNV